ncbi:MAG: PKD domain-containing protein, partial [Saprospiraceae bacterium]|nr:PKD domain-containing protein [Saprospiraceae bacterium]
MKKFLLSLFSFLILYSISLPAQITITANDLLNVGETSSDVQAIVTPGTSAGAPGANQTYDFSMLAPDDTTTTTFISPNGTPGFSSYPNATLASEFEEGFLYYQKTASEAFLLGSYIDTSENNTGQFIAVPFNPTQKILEFPTTFNTAYTDTWAITATFADESGFADSIRSTTTTTEDILFDGFGTVITPEGSFNGLRERIYSTTVSKTEVLSSGFWVTLQETQFMDTSYIWFAKESKGPLVTIDIDQGQISNATYALINSVTVAPNAAFTFADQGGGVVNFMDNSTNDPTSWTWDFGDGKTSTAQSPSHTFAGPGEYNVCLTATNSAGSNTTCSSVSIVLAPMASFSFMDQGGGVVDFMDNSTNDPTSWTWDFGDGNTSTAQSPSHTFAGPGEYNVCLTATNSAGSNTTCSSVSIVLAPMASFSFTDQGGG